MKKLNRTAWSVLGLGLSSGLILYSAGCSVNVPSPGGSGGINGAGGDGAGGIISGSGAAGPSSGGAGPGAGGDGAGGITGAGGDGAGGNGAGGDGAGGVPGTGGGGGTEVIPKPALITSTNGDFWNTSATPTAGGTSATITVNPETEHQDWIGWGGTFNEKGWQALMGLGQAERDNVMRLLFSQVDGLGLTWGRIPMGASDYAVERYSLCDSPCDETNLNETFSIEHDKDPGRGLIPYIKAAQAVVNAEKAQYAGIQDTKYWGSPWTPPPWMKTNNAYDKGVMRNEPAILDAYALYFVKWIQGYEAEGIPIDHVYPQNEPGWAQGYPSCAWGPYTDGSTSNTSTPAFLGNFVEDNLIPALTTAGLQTDVWFGTLSNNAHFSAYWGSLQDKSVVAGIGLQWETLQSISTPVNAGVTVMQSEHRCGNYPWVGNSNGDGSYSSSAASAEAADYDTFWEPYAPNNYNYGVESWGLIKDWIEGGANGYSAWNMVLDRVGRNLDEIRPWPQNALISFNEDGTVKVTPYYYVFRHFTQYVKPGSKRIAVTGGDALAFKNPDGSIVTVMYNAGAATQVTLSVGGNMVQFQAPANGWATVNTPAP